MNDETIFFTARGLASAAEQAAYLDRACAADPERRRRIEELLESDMASGFLEHPALGMDARAMNETVTGANGATARPRLSDDILHRLHPSPRPDSLGRLDHYEVLEALGQGGFGTVVRAFDERLHRVVALKILAPHLAASGSARQRFLREARSAAAVRDEHIVTVFAVSNDEVVWPYLAMEFIGGQTLQSKIEKTGPLPPREVLRIGAQIAKGLAAAHATGLIHRDIKPANVLLENGVERVKITDFGLARAVDDASLTQTGVVAGTPMYMSPEQARGEAMDHRSDLFSLGSVLYMMATGRPPFRAANTLATLKRVCEDQPRALREIDPGLPDWLSDVIEKLHEKNPSQRFQSATELAVLLTDYLADLQLHGRVVPHPPRPTARKKLIQSAGVLIAVATAAALITFLAVYLANGMPGAPSNVAEQGTSVGEPTSQVEPTAPNAGATVGPAGSGQATPQSEPTTPVDIPERPSPVALSATFTAEDEARLAELPGDEQVKAVVREIQRLNPRFNAQTERVKGWYHRQPKIEDGVLTGLELGMDRVNDVSPLRALRGMRHLLISGSAAAGSPLIDISPLRSLNLVDISLAWNPNLSDISPLAGMELRHVDLIGTGVRDIEVLRPMPLTVVLLLGTPVEDLAPLTGKRLQRLSLTPSRIKHYSGLPLEGVEILGCPLRELPPEWELQRLGVRQLQLHKVNLKQDAVKLLELRHRVTEIDWQPAKQVYEELDAALRLELPPPLTADEVERLSRLPPVEQLAAVASELKRRNPGFNGRLTGWQGALEPRIEEGAVVEVGLDATRVTDLSPLRAFRRLRGLTCTPAAAPGALRDLSPLQDLPLEKLACGQNPGVVDLAPLAGKRLQQLFLNGTGVADLSPIREAPLTDLDLSRTPVSNFGPLADKRLNSLNVAAMQKSDWTLLPLTSVTSLTCTLAHAPNQAELRRLGVKELNIEGVDLLGDVEKVRALREWLSTINGQPAEPVFSAFDMPK